MFDKPTVLNPNSCKINRISLSIMLKCLYDFIESPLVYVFV